MGQVVGGGVLMTEGARWSQLRSIAVAGAAAAGRLASSAAVTAAAAGAATASEDAAGKQGTGLQWHDCSAAYLVILRREYAVAFA